MMRYDPSYGALFLAVGSSCYVAGCTSADAIGMTSAGEGTPDSSRLTEGGAKRTAQRLVDLTLYPLYEYEVHEHGWGNRRTELGDVTICVDRFRPKHVAVDGTWDDFEDATDKGWCTTTVLGEKTVLENVPADAELVVTATKEDYVPSVFAIITGATDTDLTDNQPIPYDPSNFRLKLRGSPSPYLPSDTELELGAIMVSTAVLADPVTLRSVTGATMELSPGSQDPHYHLGGNHVDATATVGSGTFSTAWDMDSSVRGGAVFIGLSKGEHMLEVEHPRASCTRTGAVILHEDQNFGAFPSGQPNVLKIPVLDGHLTPGVRVNCVCDATLAFPPRPLADLSSCSEVVSDGGPG